LGRNRLEAGRDYWEEAGREAGRNDWEEAG
jgi:hypothetical protein